MTALGPDSLPLRTFFVRPGDLPPLAKLGQRVAVLDVAFHNETGARDLDWVDQLGDRFAVWIDHHEQDRWEGLQGDARYLLVPRHLAPACPPLVTAEVVCRYGPCDTLVSHGDLDGVLSAAKWMLLQEELEAPAWLDPDSIAADTRKGTLTDRGARLDHALRGSLGRTRIQRAIVASALAEARGITEPPEVTELLDRSAASHARMRETAKQVASRATVLDDISESAALVNLLEYPSDLRIDLTETMLRLQREYDFVVVIARMGGGRRKLVVSTDPARSGLDLRKEFDLQGFAPFRVHVEAEKLLERLPSKALARTLQPAG